MTRRREA